MPYMDCLIPPGHGRRPAVKRGRPSSDRTSSKAPAARPMQRRRVSATGGTHEHGSKSGEVDADGVIDLTGVGDDVAGEGQCEDEEMVDAEDGEEVRIRLRTQEGTETRTVSSTAVLELSRELGELAYRYYCTRAQAQRVYMMGPEDRFESRQTYFVVRVGA